MKYFVVSKNRLPKDIEQRLLKLGFKDYKETYEIPLRYLIKETKWKSLQKTMLIGLKKLTVS